MCCSLAIRGIDPGDMREVAVTEAIPLGARATARVLLLSSRDRLLLREATDSSGNKWWAAPGGGLADGESFEGAALFLWAENMLLRFGRFRYSVLSEGTYGKECGGLV